MGRTFTWWAVFMCGILVIGFVSSSRAQTPGALLEFNASYQSPTDTTFENIGSLGGSIGAAIHLHSGEPPQLNTADGPGGNLTKSYMNVDNNGNPAAWGGSVGPFSASAVTWEWWVKWDGTETTEHYMGTLLNQPSWSQYIDWHTGRQAAGGSVNHASPQANGAGYLGNLIGPIPTNEWVQLVLTVDDSTDTAQGFINGQPTAEGPRSVADPSLDNEFNWVGIGNSVYGTDSSQSNASRWQGQIALMRFYDFVLTDQQVLDNFNLSAGPPPTDFSWNVDAAGNWETNGNWTVGGSPGFNPQINANQTATFGDVITQRRTISSDTDLSLRAITFDNSNTYVVAGTGTVSLVQGTIGGSPDNSSIAVVQGSHEFQLRVTLENDVDVEVGTDANLIFQNALNLNGNTLTKTGGGTLSIRNDFVTSGGRLNIAEGTVSGNGTVGGDLSNAAGTIAPGNSPGVLTLDGNLTNGSAGTIAMEIEGTGGAGEADGHDQIQVTGSSNFDGTLAVTTGGSYADPTTRSARDHFTLITSAGGSTGSFSSVAYDGTVLSADFAGDNGSFRDHVGSGLFRNVNYDGSDVSLTNLFALEGDADGDADIDITDFNILASNFDDAGANSATNDWTTADFDADGDVDITDFNFLASNFADTGYGGAVNSVPEPTGILLAVLTFMALMNRSIFNNRGGANRQSQSLG